MIERYQAAAQGALNQADAGDRPHARVEYLITERGRTQYTPSRVPNRNTHILPADSIPACEALIDR